ncbi:Receptor-like protein kinase HERK 1 [Ananas comosus]|uniref:Receptor-like protein kinase HERK 1 n=1 Tax=Ananas comosus TaxID=4615 RepID=A0A199V2Q6_ANACO|nr:Receptor-like protein kinase HERK 1 [Ananas comosus]
MGFDLWVPRQLPNRLRSSSNAPSRKNLLADDSLSSTLTTLKPSSLRPRQTPVASFDDASSTEPPRIFTGPSSYSFPIQKHGRHFIRLYFFPFTYQSYSLSAAKFTVSTQDAVLLSDFQPPSNPAPVFKEFSLT